MKIWSWYGAGDGFAAMLPVRKEDVFNGILPFNGPIEQPATGQQLTYFMSCWQVGNGWSCDVRLDDSHEQFSPDNPLDLRQLSLVPDGVALLVLEHCHKGR